MLFSLNKVPFTWKRENRSWLGALWLANENALCVLFFAKQAPLVVEHPPGHDSSL